MPLTVSNPRDLLLVQLADILFVERVLSFEVLPELLGRVSDTELTTVIADHLAESKRHVENVERSFTAVGAEPSSNHSPSLVGLKDQHSEVADGIKALALADLWHANAAIHAEHYEIAAYRQLRLLAELLGNRELDQLLAENLQDEEQALSRLEQAASDLGKRAVGAR